MIIKYIKEWMRNEMNDEKWNRWWKSENDDKKCKRNEGDNEGVKVIVSERDEKVLIKRRGSKRNEKDKKLISIVLVIEKQ